MKKKLYSAVILAGGLATRLQPLSHSIPKSLVEIHGEPFIAHQLRLLSRNGIDQVVLCLGHLGEQILDYVGDAKLFGLQVSYSFDGKNLLGTAGAIKKALPLLTDNFFVLYGDSYLLCNYQEIQAAYEKDNKNALMTVFCNQGQWDKSNVEFVDGKIIAYDKTRSSEKMHHIDYGLGILNKKVFSHIAHGEQYDLAQLYQELLKQQQLAAFEVKERFYEIGSFSGIEELKNLLLSSTHAI